MTRFIRTLLKIRETRARIERRIQDSISHTKANASAKPPAKTASRIISQKPFVMVRGA